MLRGYKEPGKSLMFLIASGPLSGRELRRMVPRATGDNATRFPNQTVTEVACILHSPLIFPPCREDGTRPLIVISSPLFVAKEMPGGKKELSKR